jgi:hypothetical protein
MTDYAAVYAASNSFTALTEISGTASADTVPAGAYLILRNTGAGAHVITLTTNNTAGGLAVADKPITIPAAGVWGGRVDPAWGDAAGRVQVAIDGATPSEVKLYLPGGV